MAFGDTSKEPKRMHFVNLMKSSKDFTGEHLAPISESDVVMLLSNKGIIDELNKRLEGSGFKLQLNWSDDQGKSWSQYPQSR